MFLRLERHTCFLQELILFVAQMFFTLGWFPVLNLWVPSRPQLTCLAVEFLARDPCQLHVSSSLPNLGEIYYGRLLHKLFFVESMSLRHA